MVCHVELARFAGARQLTGLPELVLSGLPSPDAAALLASAVPGRLDGRVRSRVLAEARGNPFALLELPRQLSAEGLTNPEIGAALYISPRNVEWHLRKVFSKLGISTRRQLRHSMPASVQTAPGMAVPFSGQRVVSGS